MVLIVEYEGTRYHGFQWQANAPTIQGELEKALHKLNGESLRIIAASRTDTGVHAEGQVVSFRTESFLPLRAFVNGLNYHLPGDVAVKAAFRVNAAFDVRRQAISREYNYFILNGLTRSPLRRGSAYLVTGRLDIEAMNQACQTLLGRHDFGSFATCLEAGTRNTVREIYGASIEKKGDLVTFGVVANAYLPHQVRNTVGSLLQVGRGRLTVGQFRNILEARRPGLAGPTVPAHGLCLMRINYPGPFGEDTWQT
ncbi:MAG: tRNA pseudouridine(38-40) synthase TruA [Chloroflexi bacterium]|nr:tRNA pseudouridine(38-40) synthase TruA [Chloroflexota bacterium]